MTHYSALTPAQQARAQYLFADALLGTDPSAYEYQLRGEDVIGRARVTSLQSPASSHQSPASANVRKPHSVRLNVAIQEVPETYITVEMIRNTEQAIQEIARSLAAAMLQTQTQEA